ncbi:MAG: carbohydrate-binding domain-containing protein [Tyzzerella sp.]|nr:carbohydrate-binding domain-containing protein [Tyzzerella sp.]
MKRKSLLVLMLALALAVSGCGNQDDKKDSGGSTNETEQSDTENSTSGEITIVDVADMFSDRDYETDYDESKSAVIELNGKSASCDSDAVKIDGSTVTITDEGTYILRGTLDDGMIIVNAEDADKPQLVLDGASITSETSAPLYILEADKVFVTLAEGTENTLSNGGAFEAIDDNNIDGAVFSKQDLTFNGSGSLTVESPVGHGIVCKDDLVFTGGTYSVTSSAHGIDANDSVRYTTAAITIASGKDGVHVENSDDTSLGFVYVANGDWNITAEGDGLSAGTYMQIDDGSFDIVTGGGSENGTKSSSDSWGNFGGGGRGGMGRPGGQMPGSSRMSMDSSSNESTDSSEDSTSMKGLKSDNDLLVNGGSFVINSADDAVHSNNSVTINGGNLEIASGDDGIHAEDTVTVSAGTINITESYEGLEGLHIAVTGGDIKLAASDDGFNAAGGNDSSGMGGRDQMGGMGQGPGMSSSSNGTIKISGGNIYINASGDGIDANGTLEISGGYTVVCGPTQGDTATLDYDQSATITGGTFIGTGASGMAQTFSDNEQGVFAVSCGNCSAGTKILLEDADGKEIISYTPELDFSVVILSTPEIVSGESYTITVGDYDPGTFEAN